MKSSSKYSEGMILSLRGGEEAAKNGRRNANRRNRAILCLIPCGLAGSRRSWTDRLNDPRDSWASGAPSAQRSTQASCDTAPVGAPRAALWQMQHDAAHRAGHPHAQLEQPLAQGGHLRACARSGSRTRAQFLHQHIGCRSEQHAQLVGPESGAAGAVDLQPVVQFFDAQFDVGSLAVDVFWS